MLRRREPIPPELSFLDPAEWRDLSGMVDRTAGRLGGRRDGSVVRMAGGQVLNLGNLARICHQLDRPDWPREVDRFLSVFRSRAEPLDMIRADPAGARRSLRVRPYPRGMFDEIPFRVVTRHLVGELVDVVCFDLPDQVAMVNEEMADSFGVGEEELFAVGLANVEHEGPPGPIGDIEVDAGVAVAGFAGESFYSATWGRWADRLVPDLDDFGALVAMPYRHQVLVHPLRTGRGAAVAPGKLLLLAHLGHGDGVGPVSAQLFWWRDGRLSHLLGAVTDEGPNFAPTEEYLYVMEALMAVRPE